MKKAIMLIALMTCACVLFSTIAFAEDTQPFFYNDGEFSFDLPSGYKLDMDEDKIKSWYDRSSGNSIYFFYDIEKAYTLETAVNFSIIVLEDWDPIDSTLKTSNGMSYVEYTYTNSSSETQKEGCWINEDTGEYYLIMFIIASNQVDDADYKTWDEIVNSVKCPGIQTNIESTSSMESNDVSESLLSPEEESGSKVTEVKKGDKNDNVKQVQEALIALGYLKGSADGSFGPKTEKAVKAFQKDNQLTENGIVTKEVMDLLQSKYQTASESETSNKTNKKTKAGSKSETYDLAYVIRGKDYWIYWVINSKTKVVRSFTTGDHGVYVGTYTGDLINGADVTYKGGAKEHICYKWAMNDSKLMIDGYYEASKTNVSSAMEYLNRPEYHDITG